MPTKRRLGVVAAGVLAYLACWGATAQLGASAVAASVGAEQSQSIIDTWSPFPFVVSVRCSRWAGNSFTAKYVWLGNLTVELSREPLSSVTPFINVWF
jgi:hypothetical protein